MRRTVPVIFCDLFINRLDSVVTARMGVEKLKQLNENMVQQAVKGKDMEHMAKYCLEILLAT